MKKLTLLILSLLVINFLKAQRKIKSDTTALEYFSLFSGGDSSYIQTYFINDSLQVRQVFFGHSFDVRNITGGSIDTFIIYKNNWKKIFNGISYPFLSLKDFTTKHETIEYLKTGWRNYRYRYTPVEKLKINGEEILVYNRDVIDEANKVQSNNTRIYFSFKYGVIGYLNLNENMVMKPFINKLKMKLRERKTD